MTCLARIWAWAAAVPLVLALATPMKPQEAAAGSQFTIQPVTLPKAVVQRPFRQALRAEGGNPPFAWSLSQGKLPPGIRLDPAAGILAGRPTASGEFKFAVQVADASQPRRVATREYVLPVLAELTMEWQDPPLLEGDFISGRVKLSNHTDDDLDLTLIAVAVNEIGKAFALGYDRFTLISGNQDWEVSFRSSVPQGSYIVHVDAVGEVASKNRIYRARLQTATPLLVE